MNGKLVKRSEMSDATKAQMYQLFSSQFENVSMQQFLHDLEDKNWVLLLRDDADKLFCFSNMHIYDKTIDDQTVTLIYSGDTVVDSSTWSDSALTYYLMGAMGWLHRRYGSGRLYWFLLAAGYRTYRLLPVYSKFFYPRFDQPTPDNMQTLMDSMAIDRFDNRYAADTGIVRLEKPSILKGSYRGIPDNRLSDPHIAYFAENNPGHDQGDELVCIAELSEQQFTKLGQRMWRKGQELFPDVA